MKIKIYSTPTCPYCHQAKEYFEENKIEFEDIDVATNETAATEMIEKTGQMGVPVIIVDDGKKQEIIIGFDKQKLSQLLKIK